MAPNRFMTDIDFLKTQIAVYFVLLLLSVDDLNPIKIVCHAIPWIQPWHVATVCIALLVYVTASELKQVLYFAVKIFFHSILSIFFRDVEVVGLENIPRRGPVLFTINHANQFVDAVTVLSTCQHKISYLMAEASFNRRVIGDIAWAMDVVPVKRAQDEAKPGKGTIRMVLEAKDEPPPPPPPPKDKSASASAETEDDHRMGNNEEEEEETIVVTGVGGTTVFTEELKPGDKIRPKDGTAFGFKVLQVIDDHKLIVSGAGRPSEYTLPSADTPASFDILAKVDTHVVFEKVLDRLASGGAVGIFPEGGSHDRTELLPLKVGIALIAYSALDKDGLLIPIVPVGLNYFRAHRWRGKAVIEYGRPTMIDPATLPHYQAGGAARRQVCNALLEDIERSMKSVIVSAPDYDTLQLIHTARRLWSTGKRGTLDTTEKQDMTRRFAEGYKMLLSIPNPPPEFIDMKNRLMQYRDTLKEMGLRDYQVLALTEEHLDQELTVNTMQKNPNQFLSVLHLSYQIVHLLVLILVASIPFLLINFPVGILGGLYAEARRKKALAKSKVKVKGYDVMLTEKIMFCILAVPLLWMTYAAILVYCTDLDLPTISLCMFCLPVFAYMGIVAAEAGMVDWEAFRPFFMRLRPKKRKLLAQLPQQRKELQADLRAFIRNVGPKYLSDFYRKKDVDWKALWEKEKQQMAIPTTSNTVPSLTNEEDDAVVVEKADASAATTTTTPKEEEEEKAKKEQ